MSIVNTEHGHVFIHVPKCAGTSMERQPWVGGRGHDTARRLTRENPELFSWGFVRNPYDRLVAVYHAATQHGDEEYRKRKWSTLEGAFGAFVKALPQKWQVLPHALPMTRFLCDPDERVLVDFVGRYESLQVDWGYVCKKLGAPVENLPRTNSTCRPPWRECYDSELLRIVNDVYREDFETFGYEMVT